MFASFRQLNYRYPNCGYCLRKRFVFLSWKHSSDEYNLSCNVWTPHRGWRYTGIPLLRQEGFFCVLKSETDRFLSSLLKVCLLVCGMVQNQRSLQSWGEAWLLAWQPKIKSEYSHIAAVCGVSQGPKGLYTCDTTFLYARSPLLPLVVKCMYCQYSHQ